MERKIYSIDDIKKKLFPLFKKYKIKQAILFGSYAKGNADSRSDIDIIVESDLRGLAFYGFLEEVVGVLDKTVDLLDKRQITKSSRIQKEIRDTGVIIYG